MTIEGNKAVVRQIEEAWDSNDLAALDDLFASNFVSLSSLPTRPPNLQTAKRRIGCMQAFSDRKAVIQDMVAEGRSGRRQDTNDWD